MGARFQCELVFGERELSLINKYQLDLAHIAVSAIKDEMVARQSADEIVKTVIEEDYTRTKGVIAKHTQYKAD